MKYLKRPEPVQEADVGEVRRTVESMLERIRTEGESAVRAFSSQLDGWNPPGFRVGEDAIRRAEQSLPETLKEDIRFAQEQVRRFARYQRDALQDLEVETLPGVTLGQRWIPVASAGAYVPGGRYPLIASAYMAIVTAKVAGVSRVVACSPPNQGRGIYPATLYAIHTSGADEIYCIGGVQALGAMAYGADIMAPVDMIVGAGNRYVAEAKRQLFGTVGVDLLAGPTEILVIADETADPAVVAADLLGQAEHDVNSPSIGIMTSEMLARRVLEEVERQLRTLPTAAVAGEAWRRNGAVVVVDSDEEAAALADEFAPEHLEVQTRNPDWYLQRLRNYGTLFLGEPATVVYSDKALGTNHILPTGRAARYTGGLWVGKFLKTVTYQRLTPRASAQIAGVAGRIARAEGMLAHEITARMRADKYGQPDRGGS